jgi:uncharacterized protein (DUF2141 family)
VNFRAKRIDITFDEYLQLKDANNQFYSSPPIEKKPEILLYSKTVRVTLKDTLLPNITYAFDFGPSITDLNEGNVATGFLYVFSTGKHIDSLTFTGRVLNAFDLKPNNKDDKTATWVMLYDDLSDSAVYKHAPTYIARTDLMGFFTFSHLRPDTFRIFALRDMGGNLKFNMPTERIAFADTLIITDQRHYRDRDTALITSRNTPDSLKETHPERILSDIILYQFEEKPTKQYRIAYERKEANMLRLVYSMPVDSITVEVMEYEPSGEWYTLETSANSDTLDYWLTDTALVSRKDILLHLHAPRTDSLNRLIYADDTLKLSYEAPKQPTKSRRERREEENKPKPRTALQTMTITTSVKSGGTMELTDRMQLTSSQPIEVADAKKIVLEEQVDTIKKPVNFTFLRDSVNARKAYIDWDLKEDTKYFLTIDSMSFTSIYNVFNDSTGINFSSQKTDYYSILSIAFDSIPCPLIVQALKGEKESVVKQISLTEGKVATIDYLKPDKYQLKVIFDRNSNGKWDTGEYLKKTQPESVSYFAEPEVETHSGVTTELQWALKINSRVEATVEETHEEEGTHDHTEGARSPSRGMQMPAGGAPRLRTQ